MGFPAKEAHRRSFHRTAISCMKVSTYAKQRRRHISQDAAKYKSNTDVNVGRTVPGLYLLPGVVTMFFVLRDLYGWPSRRRVAQFDERPSSMAYTIAQRYLDHKEYGNLP